MKKCTICKKLKDDNQFYKVNSEKNYLGSRCKKCDNHRGSSKPSKKFKQYKRNALIRQKDFCITKQEFMKFWKKDCHYCGSKIETIGIDRIDNSKGYILGNIIPCCTKCNLMKGKISQKEFLEHCVKVSIHNERPTLEITPSGR